MSKIIPQIYSGNDSLIISESFLADDLEPVVVKIPTTDQKGAMLIFVIHRSDSNQSEFKVADEENKTKVTFSLGPDVGTHLGTKHKARIKISGREYHLLFGATRFVGNSVRIEITLYEIGVFK